MAMTVGEAKVLIEGDLSKLSKSLDAAEQKTRSWTSKIGAFLTGAFVVGAGIAITKFVGLVINGFKKALAVTKSFASSVIEASSTYEQLRLTLNVLLKDQNKANAAFDEARELAAKTAFSIEEITRGYTSLLTFGFDQTKIPETLLLAADAATAFGQNLDEVIRALSYLKAGRKGEALESLARFGISRTELVKRGASFSAGGELQTDTEKLFAIIESIWGDTVKGMSVEGTKTWKGMVSNLQDTWTDFLNTVGEAGIFDLVKEKLAGIMAWVERNSEQIKKWATDISKFFTDTFSGLSAILEKVFGINLSPEVMPNIQKSDEELAKMLGWDEARMREVNIFLANGFTDAMKSTPEWKKIGEDVNKYLDLKNVITGGEGATLTPFWEKIVQEIEGGTFKDRITSAMASMIRGLTASEDIKGAAKDIGKVIIDGVGDGLEEQWEKWKEAHPFFTFLFGGGVGTVAGQARNDFIASNLNPFNARF